MPDSVPPTDPPTHTVPPAEPSEWGAEPSMLRGEARARMMRRRRIAAVSVAGALIVLLSGGATAWALLANAPRQEAAATPKPVSTPRSTPTPTATTPKSPEPTATPEPTPAPAPAPSFDIDNPSSITVVVNKQRQINPAGWAPDDLVAPNVPNSGGQPLRAEAAAALEQMYAESVAARVPFAILSAFRGYDMQQQLFNSYAAQDGVAAAETYSARPGFSEHQTGLVADISECLGCGLSYEFGTMPQGVWARENAWRFGFILRYQDGQQPVVGYVYEPWHFRYVGPEVAADMHAKGIVNLEDYFGLPAAPGY